LLTGATPGIEAAKLGTFREAFSRGMTGRHPPVKNRDRRRIRGGMPMAQKPRIIALEEHYFDPEVKRHTVGQEPTNAPRIVERLDDVGELRLREMDEAGIDLQVLSHANPGLQKLDAETAVRLARGANDRLHEAVRAHPDRFAAFAAIPTPDPKANAAADELERTVTRLGFKGALVNGLTNGRFLDDKRADMSV
jgi:predicted TIM-barrel fold metal-dependent hydrolase